MKKIGIVGGGLLGITLALRLTQQGFQVTLMERESTIGGLASPGKIGAYTWDQFYHVILRSDSHLLNLLDELNLADQIHWRQAKTGFYADGTLYSISNLKEFLTFPPLNLVDRLRLGLTIFYASRLKSWMRLENISAEDWLVSLSGKKTFAKVWLPLLRSKLGEKYKLANASFIWANVARMYAARRSGLKQEEFGHVHGGYASILGWVQQYLDRAGVETLCRADVEMVTSNKDGVHVQTRAGGTRKWDRVILTLPSGDIPRLCFQLSPSEKQRLQDVTYQGVLCASLILRKPLAGNYITNIADQRAPFAAVIEMTALVDRANFDGNSLVYLPRYQSQDDTYWTKKDDEIREEWVSYLQTIYPQCQKEDVVSFNLTKASHVLPVTTLDYSWKLLPPVRTSLKNVYVVNSAQIPNGTMNGNEIVGLANRRAKEITELLST